MKRVLAIFRLLNLPCEDMTALISQSSDRALPFWERFAYKTHVLYCKACRRYRKQLGQLREMLKRAQGDSELLDRPGGPTLSPEARASLTQAINEQR